MRGSTVAVWVALGCVAVALRPQLFGVTPLFPAIREAFDVQFGLLGLLVTIPVLSMGVASFVGPRLAFRFGVVPTATLAMAVLAIAGLLRAAMTDLPGLIAASVPLGVGAGLGGVLLPMIAKATIPARLASASTAFYTAGLQVGGAITAALVIPIAEATGGWRPTLAVLGLGTIGLLALWLMLAPFLPAGQPLGRVPEAAPPDLRRWLPATIAAFSLLILLFQGLNAWLPAMLVERGWSAVEAGSLLAALVIAQVPGTLVAGAMGDRRGARRSWIAGSALAVCAAMVLLATVPDGSWIWAIVAGSGLGVAAPIILVIPLDFGADARAVGRSAGTILGLGYIVASSAPALMGSMRDATGSFTSSIWLLAAIALALAAVGWTIPRRGTTD
jgi:CP family cyanate transporter-like MFS transporter